MRQFRVMLALASAAVLGGCARTCRPAPKRDPVGPGIDAASHRDDAGVRANVRSRSGGTNVTFAVVSDTHLGYAGMDVANRALVRSVDAIASRPYPANIGGLVDKPVGLFVTGDLTEWGRVEEWQPFVAIFETERAQHAGATARLFEMIGNHDKVHGPWVADQVAARHGGRFYSADFGDVHAVSLGEAPDDAGLAWLTNDLETLANDTPLVLFFHLPLAGPWSDDLWFGSGDYKERLFRIIEKRNVAAIFHGHHHATDHYVWRGIDVFKPGAVKNDAHTFAVVHITDDRFTLGSFDWNNDSWASSFVKSLPPLRPSGVHKTPPPP